MKQAADWVSNKYVEVSAQESLREVIRRLSGQRGATAVVMDENGQPAGLLCRDDLLQAAGEEKLDETAVDMMRPVQKVSPSFPAAELPGFGGQALLVADEADSIIGILGEQEQLRSAMAQMKADKEEADNMLKMLRTVLQAAYEGVVVVDVDGIIREFNQAYSDFTGVPIREAIGRHVTEVIDNTRLHITIQTGIPERSSIQNIVGQEMVVHRIPIWREGHVVGAIGIVIFQGVSEIYSMLNRLQSLSQAVAVGKKQPLLKEEQPAAAEVHGFDGIIGKSASLAAIKRIAMKAAKVPSTVLITGESGTGKEVFAKAIHSASRYASGNFVGVNCAAIPEQLLEAELFGYDEGSFTGAKRGGKAGKFELAHNGTIFLDEIGDMPLYMQAKILRVLEERVIERVGGVKPKPINVRIIAATNKNLEEMVKAGTFREDLFFRLNIIRICIPSLRERKQDIPELVSCHLERICKLFQMDRKECTQEVMKLFMDYSWPGNIRELVNVLEMLVGLVEGPVILPAHLPAYLLDRKETAHAVQEEGEGDWKQQIKQQEGERLRQILIEERGNKTAAAKRLGIHRSTLYEKMRKYHLVSD
ncbi:sigma 54-interacting transcriptional regulator [Ectobacillus ponti]|uniref:Sigma 54-interacting transcriptional regulator n=1 Tax=Ectobacillus ponti TaxID=2961894 RepID=A0AA42BP03_9BACI|nr:sigma 54-interacting transcriptional regulator [Ectobacillus ponti]MCP8967074.1 sigma 54-interacting transcriptional regulator [Ectobacillus ponti]